MGLASFHFFSSFFSSFSSPSSFFPLLRPEILFPFPRLLPLKAQRKLRRWVLVRLETFSEIAHPTLTGPPPVWSPLSSATKHGSLGPLVLFWRRPTPAHVVASARCQREPVLACLDSVGLSCSWPLRLASVTLAPSFCLPFLARADRGYGVRTTTRWTAARGPCRKGLAWAGRSKTEGAGRDRPEGSPGQAMQ